MDLTGPISPAYSPSCSTVISSEEELAVETARVPKTPTKARRTGLGLESAAALLKARKSKIRANKEVAPNKKTNKDAPKKPKLLANNTAAGRLSSAIAKAKKDRARVSSKALTTAPKSKNPKPRVALTPKASKITKKRSKAERALEDVYEYLSERSSAQEANQVATKPAIGQLMRDQLKDAQLKLKMAEKRALRAKTTMESAIAETNIARCDVAVASERLRVAKKYEEHTHQSAGDFVMGDGFLNFKEHILAMKLPEFSWANDERV